MTERRGPTYLRELRRRLRDRGVGEAGLTLVELLVAMALLGLLMAIVSTSVDAYVGASNTVSSSYQATDQLLPSTVVIQRLIRAEVEPAPTPAATPANPFPTPTPAFVPSSLTPTSMTFTSNVGNPNGPDLVTMSTAASTPCGHCQYPTTSFTVTETAPAPGTCPGVSSGTACSWTGTTKTVVDVLDVAVTGSPVFTYFVQDCSNSVPVTNPSATFDPSSTTTVDVTACAPSTQTATTTGPCTGSVDLAESCPADAIQSVEVDLPVEVPGAPLQATDFTVYRMSSTSYLYNPLVG